MEDKRKGFKMDARLQQLIYGVMQEYAAKIAYSSVADVAGDPHVASLLRRVAKDEMRHCRFFQLCLEALAGNLDEDGHQGNNSRLRQALFKDHRMPQEHIPMFGEFDLGTDLYIKFWTPEYRSNLLLYLTNYFRGFPGAEGGAPGRSRGQRASADSQWKGSEIVPWTAERRSTTASSGAWRSVRWSLADVSLPRHRHHGSSTTSRLTFLRVNCLMELSSLYATRMFLRDFRENPDFCQFVSIWYYEEMKHYLVLREYLKAYGVAPDVSRVPRARHGAQPEPLDSDAGPSLLRRAASRDVVPPVEPGGEGARCAPGSTSSSGTTSSDTPPATRSSWRRPFGRDPATLIDFMQAAKWMLVNPNRDKHPTTMKAALESDAAVVDSIEGLRGPCRKHIRRTISDEDEERLRRPGAGHPGTWPAGCFGRWPTSPPTPGTWSRRRRVQHQRRREPGGAGPMSSGSDVVRASRRRPASGRPAAGDSRVHYDTPPRAFELLLDRNMNYSSGYYPRGDESLDDGQVAKLERIGRGLDLARGDRILDLGCGWSGPACSTPSATAAVSPG